MQTPFIEKIEFHVEIDGSAEYWYDENQKAEAIEKAKEVGGNVEKVTYWGNTRETIFESDQ